MKANEAVANYSHPPQLPADRASNERSLQPAAPASIQEAAQRTAVFAFNPHAAQFQPNAAIPMPQNRVTATSLQPDSQKIPEQTLNLHYLKKYGIQKFADLKIALQSAPKRHAAAWLEIAYSLACTGEGHPGYNVHRTVSKSIAAHFLKMNGLDADIMENFHMILKNLKHTSEKSYPSLA